MSAIYMPLKKKILEKNNDEFLIFCFKQVSSFDNILFKVVTAK